MFGLGCVSKSESSYALRVRRCVRRVIWGAVIAGLPILPSSVTCALHAQTDKTQKTDKTEKAEKSERKLIYKEVPVYPAELKSHYIGGKVRLKIGVSPRGTVDTVTPIGGNPILTEAAVAAVKKWKYAPAASATTMDVEFTFNPFH